MTTGPEHVDVVNRRCQVAGCKKHPTYGDPSQQRPDFFQRHRQETHVYWWGKNK
jgi:hypothetical protein